MAVLKDASVQAERFYGMKIVLMQQNAQVVYVFKCFVNNMPINTFFVPSYIHVLDIKNIFKSIC